MGSNGQALLWLVGLWRYWQSSFATINAFVDFTLAKRTRNEAAVWLVLWRDTKDGTTRTAQTDIARRAGINRRTVIRILDKLESTGLLRIVHRGGFNRG